MSLSAIECRFEVISKDEYQIQEAMEIQVDEEQWKKVLEEMKMMELTKATLACEGEGMQFNVVDS